MGAQGTTTVDFGSFPGSGHATVAVTGQATILSGSLVEAYLFPTATSDHSADEHLAMAGAIRVVAAAPTAGVGFTINAFAPDTPGAGNASDPREGSASDGILLYGQWTLAWVWN